MSPESRFIDLQVNGYAGVDFNADDLSDEQLHFACEQLREDGVAGILATIITAEISEDVGPAATNRRHLPAGSLGVQASCGGCTLRGRSSTKRPDTSAPIRRRTFAWATST